MPDVSLLSILPPVEQLQDRLGFLNRELQLTRAMLRAAVRAEKYQGSAVGDKGVLPLPLITAGEGTGRGN